MKKHSLVGPVNFRNASPTVDDIPTKLRGFYLWTIYCDDGVHRVHYVGEAVDIRNRLKRHRSMHLSGSYTGFSPDSLKQNQLILMHRAREGMIPKFSKIDRKAFNEMLLDTYEVFYCDLGQDASKGLLRRYEAGIYRAVENFGQSILSVGSIGIDNEVPFYATFDTQDFAIEAVSGEDILIGKPQ